MSEKKRKGKRKCVEPFRIPPYCFGKSFYERYGITEEEWFEQCVRGMDG